MAPLPPDGPRLAVLAVCLGNICRSPMAEAVLTARVRDAGMDDWVEVASAGTGGWHVGESADRRARAALRAAGYDLDGPHHRHGARQVDATWLSRTDLVLAMDSDNRAALLRLAPDDAVRARIRMMRSFDPTLADLPGGDRRLDVPDPYYDGGFDGVLAQLEAAADGVVTHLRQRTAG